MTWRVFAASAIGKNHIDVNLPCQDAFAFQCQGNWLAAVVCDGAGSASRSELGSAECARQTIVELVAQLADPSFPGSVSVELVKSTIVTARQRVILLAKEHQLDARDLACTLVGAVLSPEGGWLFHVGDGFAAAELPQGGPVVSQPENGEYSNETYFITGEDWSEHLRLTPIPAGATCLALMSDGAMPFVVSRDKSGLSPPFIDPVRTYLSGVADNEGSEALRNTLADERTWAITGDDKTLLIALAT